MSKRFAVTDASERVSHALIGIARDLELRMLTRLQDDLGHGGLRPSLGPFLSLVWLDARSLGELAQDLGVSKQACNQLAGIALKAGFIVRRSAPGPARGQVVALSARGRVLVDDAIGILREAEIEYEKAVGPVRFRQLAGAVAKLHRSLEVQPPVEGSRTSPVAPRLGGLPQLAVELQRRLIEATASLGHRGLKPSQGLVLPLIGPEGARVRDLARRHRVSRQSISLTGLELESLGYLRRAPDPTDRRGTILQRTPRGDRLLADADEAAARLDRSLAADLGEAAFEALRETAGLLFGSLRASDDPEAPVRKSRLRLRVGSPPPESPPDDSDLDRLAASLRLRLGARDAARLGALLVADRNATEGAGGRRRNARRRA
jgi:DNA-binding MarR family transcriptional regulator